MLKIKCFGFGDSSREEFFAGLFVFDVPPAEGKPIVESTEKIPVAPQPEKPQTPDTALSKGESIVAGQLGKLGRFDKLVPRERDKYEKAWHEGKIITDEDAKKFPPKFSPNQTVAVRGLLNFRNASNGKSEKKFQEGTQLKITDPSVRIIVADKVFIAIQTNDSSGIFGYVAEEYLVPKPKEEKPPKKPEAPPAKSRPAVSTAPIEQKKPVEAKAAAKISTPVGEQPAQKAALPHGWVEDKDSGITRQMTPEELAAQSIDKSVTIKEKPKGKLNEYLEGHADLKAFVESLRTGLNEELKKFESSAKGTKVEGLANNLRRDYESNFDQHIFNIFNAIGLRDDPILVRRVLSNVSVPRVVISNQLPQGVWAKASPEKNPPIIEINSQNQTGDYQSFTHVFNHEYLHIAIQSISQNQSFLANQAGEGLIDYYTEKVTGRPAGENAYSDQKNVAKALVRINERATKHWLAGAMDDGEYKNELKKTMDPAQVDLLFSVTTEYASAKEKVKTAFKEDLGKIVDPNKKAKITNAIMTYLSNGTGLKEITTLAYSAIPNQETATLFVNKFMGIREDFEERSSSIFKSFASRYEKTNTAVAQNTPRKKGPKATSRGT